MKSKNTNLVILIGLAGLLSLLGGLYWVQTERATRAVSFSGGGNEVQSVKKTQSLQQVLAENCSESENKVVPFEVLPFSLTSGLKNAYGMSSGLKCYCEGTMGGCTPDSYYLQAESPGVGSVYFVAADSLTTGTGSIFFEEMLAFPTYRVNQPDRANYAWVANPILEALERPMQEETGVLTKITSTDGECDITFPLRMTAYGHKFSPDGEIVATAFSRTYDPENPHLMFNYMDYGRAVDDGSKPSVQAQILSFLQASLTNCNSGSEWNLRTGVNRDEFLQELQELVKQLPVYEVLQAEVREILAQIEF